MLTEISSGVYANAYVAIVTVPSGMSAALRPEYAKAYAAIVCTDEGMSTNARFSHPAKAYVPIVATELGMWIDRSAVQFSNE